MIKELNCLRALDQDKEIVIAKFRGPLDYQNFVEVDFQCRKLAHRMGFALILDCQHAQIDIPLRELLTWFLDRYLDDLHLREVTTFFLIDSKFYPADRLNLAWAPFKVPSYASHQSLNEIQAIVEEQPYGVWR
ncbi:MAG: hypothetical protein NXI09_05940 [Bacteroidetes bacterium]|nr:hypothetical protein [Bacteroidota bacterium]